MTFSHQYVGLEYPWPPVGVEYYIYNPAYSRYGVFQGDIVVGGLGNFQSSDCWPSWTICISYIKWKYMIEVVSLFMDNKINLW